MMKVWIMVAVSLFTVVALAGKGGGGGKSGDDHGKSGEEHGKSGDDHGKSGDDHGKSCNVETQTKNDARQALFKCLGDWQNYNQAKDTEPTSDCTVETLKFTSAARALQACRAN
jgi:hypothetical protein